jgi:hypothetical protein
MNKNRASVFATLVALIIFLSAALMPADEMGKNAPVIPQLTPSPTFSDSTVPANGDVNPYGVATD